MVVLPPAILQPGQTDLYAVSAQRSIGYSSAEELQALANKSADALCKDKGKSRQTFSESGENGFSAAWREVQFRCV